MNIPDSIETSIVKKYKKPIWHRFVKAAREYSLVNEGDRIACLVGGNVQSLLAAKCFERLHKYSEVPFELAFVCTEEIADPLGLETVKAESPYAYIKENGFDKLALPDCFDDCIEHILEAELYEGRLEALPPLSHKEGIAVIRPALLVRREDIAAFARYNSLSLPLYAYEDTDRRLKVRSVIAELAKTNKNLEINILRSCEDVNPETIISYIDNGEKKSILDTL